MELRSDRTYQFDLPPEQLWAALGATDEYLAWWPWLRELSAEGLIAGDRWRCRVQPPLPYAVRFTIHLDEVRPPTTVAAHITGDIEGVARLEIAQNGTGCEALLTSTLRPSSRAFRAMSLVARPLIRRGHDWVLEAGARQFVAHAVDRA